MIALSGKAGVGAISATQIVGWGSTYFIPAILAEPIGASLGVSVPIVFSGITIMLVAGAFAGTAIGRHVDRHGPRGVMMTGSVLMATGLALLATASGLPGFVAAWTVMGLGMPMVLIQTPFAAAAQLMPAGARRAIGVMTLFGSLTTALFLPAIAWLDGALGWRGACLFFAVLQIVVCLPLHAVLRVNPVTRDPSGAVAAAPADGIADPQLRRRAFWTMALAFACVGFVTWGLPLMLVDIAKGYGQPVALAIFAGAVVGPAQMVSRALEAAFGQRVHILDVGAASLVTILAALALPLAFGGGAAMLVAMALGYGAGAGANTIVRAVAPLVVFGRSGYATVMGSMGLPLNLVFATAPFVLAAANDAFGPAAPVAICAVASAVSLGAMLALRRIAGLQ